MMHLIIHSTWMLININNMQLFMLIFWSNIFRDIYIQKLLINYKQYMLFKYILTYLICTIIYKMILYFNLFNWLQILNIFITIYIVNIYVKIHVTDNNYLILMLLQLLFNICLCLYIYLWYICNCYISIYQHYIVHVLLY